MAKKANKRPTRAQRDSNSAPITHKCNACGYVALSKYALKEHKDYCHG